MWTVPAGTIGEETSLRVLSPRRRREVVKQIEGPSRTDPIMRRLRADREEKRVTRGNGTKNPTGALDPQSPNQRGSQKQTLPVCVPLDGRAPVVTCPVDRGSM